MQTISSPANFWIQWSDVTLRDSNETLLFPHTQWTWKPGQQWAILGANGSGKKYIVSALLRRQQPFQGKITFQLPPTPSELDIPGLANRQIIFKISPEDHRQILASQSSFYQSRWHSGLEEGSLTADSFLSHKVVEDINPFEVGTRGADPQLFYQRRQKLLTQLNISPELLERKILHLSNGEQRKILLLFALLHAPQMLILEEPFGSLDVQTRQTLRQFIDYLVHLGMPILTLVSRPDELPDSVSHLHLLAAGKIIASGTRQEILSLPQARLLESQIRTQKSPIYSKHLFRSSSPKEEIHNLESLIEIKDINFKIGNKIILDHINWTIHPGENWVILGPNGAGKTSLLSLIQGDHPLAYSLNIRVMGESYRSTHSLWKIRQKMGWLSPELHLHYPGNWNAQEVVCSGYFHSMGLHTLPNQEQLTYAEELLNNLLPEINLESLFEQLSIGQQRLLLLIRALVNRPQLLILDEPCQALDTLYRTTLLDTVDAAIAQTGTTLIFVTHHAEEIPLCVNRLLRLNQGQIVEQKQICSIAHS